MSYLKWWVLYDTRKFAWPKIQIVCNQSLKVLFECHSPTLAITPQRYQFISAACRRVQLLGVLAPNLALALKNLMRADIQYGDSYFREIPLQAVVLHLGFTVLRSHGEFPILSTQVGFGVEESCEGRLRTWWIVLQTNFRQANFYFSTNGGRGVGWFEGVCSGDIKSHAIWGAGLFKV